MDTQQVERDLIAILHRRAEVAMNETNTHQQHRQFQAEVVGQPRRDRRRWVVAGAAAAVVALAVGVALWPSAPDREGSQLPGATVPDATNAANLAAAEAAAAAYVAHDPELMAPYLEPGVSPSAASWAAEMNRDAAWEIEYLMEPCQEVSTTVFVCSFRDYMLGSREVGKEPFNDNKVTVIVEDGKIVNAEISRSWQTNGTSLYLEAVAAWREKNPPTYPLCAPRSPKACFKFMEKQEQDVTSAEWPTWTGLWQRTIADYVAATNEAG